MRELPYFTREEYALTKVALEGSDVPAEALALLSAWIEGERLLVDGREDVGGINFCRMDAKVMAPLPHIVASFFARRPYKRKAGHYRNWNGFYLLLYRDVEEGWKLVRIGRNTSYAQFVPLFAARSKAVEEINKGSATIWETMRSEDEKASTALKLDAMKKLSRRGVMNRCRSIP